MSIFYKRVATQMQISAAIPAAGGVGFDVRHVLTKTNFDKLVMNTALFWRMASPSVSNTLVRNPIVVGNAFATLYRTATGHHSVKSIVHWFVRLPVIYPAGVALAVTDSWLRLSGMAAVSNVGRPIVNPYASNHSWTRFFVENIALGAGQGMFPLPWGLLAKQQAYRVAVRSAHAALTPSTFAPVEHMKNEVVAQKALVFHRQNLFGQVALLYRNHGLVGLAQGGAGASIAFSVNNLVSGGTLFTSLFTS
ncbi:hypothetical protein EBR96_06110, partial [bacterium]|nr:hypothetical protein [bacterium]